MEKFTMKTPDGLAANIAAMKKLFPEIVTEGKIDFEQLKTILGEEIAGDERYQFTWAGKRDAMYEASTPTTKTLRPCVEESKDWENTKNIYIEGDNLEALKILQNTYGGKVKMIYIDPPYNTGHDFIYHDNFHGTKQQELIKEGMVDAETGERFKVNSESNGHFHSDWCSMMYPRLKLARNLLRDDGFVFVSIGDEESCNAKKLLDEVFGESNYRNAIATRRYDKNLNRQFMDEGLATLNVGYEFVFVYSKTSQCKFLPVFRDATTERSSEGYWKGFWNAADRPTMRYKILDVKPEEGQWKWQESVAKEAVENYEVYKRDFSAKMSIEEYWKNTGMSKRFLRREKDGKGKNRGVEHWVAPTDKILRTSNWTDMLASKPCGLPFDSPKNTDVILELARLAGVSDDGVVLDFFSGSATTAHAVMQLNAEDGGNRKFILVQLPEVCAEGSEAAKAGYKNICEIGKERIRRAGEKIIDEMAAKNAKESAPNLFRQDLQDSHDLRDGDNSVNPVNPVQRQSKLDVGFRVFKVDSSNMDDIYFQPLEVQQQDMIRMINNVKTDRTALDLLFGCLLEWGLPIDLPITKRTDLGNDTYDVDGGRIIASFDSNVGDAVVKAIANKKPDFAIFRDLSFNNSAAKINVGEIFKAISPNTVVKVL